MDDCLIFVIIKGGNGGDGGENGGGGGGGVQIVGIENDSFRR